MKRPPATDTPSTIPWLRTSNQGNASDGAHWFERCVTTWVAELTGEAAA